MSAETALSRAEVVVPAVPDSAIGKVAAMVVPAVAPGAMVVCLAAAASFAGHLPDRAEITCFVTHPCHPPIFNDETDPAAKRGFSGGVAAKQGIVNAPMQGPDAHYALGEMVARTIFAPVARSHRVTVSKWRCWNPACGKRCAPRCCR